MKAILRKLLTVRCPNCASAWTGGHPNPEDVHHCSLCGGGKDGPPGWLWRLPMFIRHRITSHNLGLIIGNSEDIRRELETGRRVLTRNWKMR